MTEIEKTILIGFLSIIVMPITATIITAYLIDLTEKREKNREKTLSKRRSSNRPKECDSS